MIRKEITVTNKTGLHARPASMFVQKASKFKSSIMIEKEDKTINAKSIISVLSGGIANVAQLIETDATMIDKRTYIFRINCVCKLIRFRFFNKLPKSLFSIIVYCRKNSNRKTLKDERE
jgi:phosphotransferase system HPr (HPr) family protein